MYQNLINSLKKILDSKSTQAEKLLKISTLVDFAEGLDRQPLPIQPPQPVQPTQTWYETGEKNPIGGGPKITASQSLIDAKKPNGVGPLIGIEDVK
jgi:hypothetical protein